MKRCAILILTAILSVCVLAGCSCSKEDENNQKKGVNTGNTTNSTTVEVSDVTESKPYTYNTTKDKNNNKVDTFNEISIDGKMIALDNATFDSVSKDFKLFHEEGKLELDVNPNTPVTKNYGCSYRPETGDARVDFVFYADSPTELKNTKLESVKVFASNTENELLMTVALPNGIKFGSTFDELKQAYGTNFESKGSVNSSRFLIEYGDLNGKKVQFSGYDKGLSGINIINKH